MSRRKIRAVTRRALERENKKTLKLLKKSSLDKLCQRMLEASKNNKGRLPHGYVPQMLIDFKLEMPWLTRDILNKSFIQLKKKELEVDSDNELLGSIPREIGPISTVVSDLESTNHSTQQIVPPVQVYTTSIESGAQTKERNVGRPQGTTALDRKRQKDKEIQCKNAITIKFKAAKKEAERRNKRVTKGKLEKIIETEKKIFGLTTTKISKSTIRTRVLKNALICTHAGQCSPLQKIEPILVQIIVQMARIRQPLTPSEGLQLVNSLIDGMHIQQELIQWKRKFSINSYGYVGTGYWNAFMKRQGHQIMSSRGQKYELDRQNWTTYRNFKHMYKHVIDEMVHAGIAKKLEVPIWMDRYGNECSQDEALGCKVTHHITRPDMCVMGDEV